MRLVAWARGAGVEHHQWLGYLWDQPRLASAAACRYDVAVEVMQGRHCGEIGGFRLPPMKVAEVVIRGGLALEMRAFRWLRDTWLPASGYLPTDLPVFEAWLGLPYSHGAEHFELACQIPIRVPTAPGGWDQRHLRTSTFRWVSLGSDTQNVCSGLSSSVHHFSSLASDPAAARFCSKRRAIELAEHEDEDEDVHGGGLFFVRVGK